MLSLDRDLRCPSCRVDVPVDATSARTNLVLAEALARLHPAEAEARAAEDAALPPVVGADAADGHSSFPLFVLEPLLPGQHMHLHVFEPRYIRLTRRALSEARLRRCFGMIAGNFSNSTGLATHGVSAEIVSSHEASGGRFYLTVKGVRRFKVLRTSELDGYRNAAISWAQDSTTLAEAHVAPDAEAKIRNYVLAHEVRSLLKQWLVEVQSGWESHPNQMENVLSRAGPMPPETALEALGLWGAAVINPLPPLGLCPEIRVAALEATDAIVRLRLVLAALETSMHAMGKRRQAAAWPVVLAKAVLGALVILWLASCCVLAVVAPPEHPMSFESLVSPADLWARIVVFMRDTAFIEWLDGYIGGADHGGGGAKVTVDAVIQDESVTGWLYTSVSSLAFSLFAL